MSSQRDADVASVDPDSGGVESAMFVSGSDDPLARGAGDATLIVLGILLAVINGLLASRTLRIEEVTTDLVGVLPAWVHEGFTVLYSLGALFGLWVILAAVLRRRPRWDIARDLLLAGLAAAAVALILVRWVDGEWPIVLPEFDRAETVARFPIFRVAVMSAIVTAAGPHLVRPLRRLGWGFVVLVAISGLGIGLGLPTDAIGGVGIGVACAGAVLIVLGSPAGYPPPGRLREELGSLGVVVGPLTPAPTQTWGARSLIGADESGQPVLVKAYGRDARDAQFFSKAWQSLWYRDTGPSLTFSRLQQVEHEALVTLLAEQADITVPAVIAAAASENDDAVLVTERRGSLLNTLDPDTLSKDQLVSLWQQVRRLHGARIAHGLLNAEHVHFDDGVPVLTGFEASSLSAQSSATNMDVVELLFSLSSFVGVERAVASASEGLGNDSLADAVGYMQAPATSRATRKAVKKPKALAKSIQDEVVRVTGVELPEPVELRRVSVRSLVTTALIVLAAYFMIQQLAGIDFASTWDAIKSADWAWVVAGFFVAQLVLIPNATSLMAAVSALIPLRPTIALQSAIQFIGLAVPSAAGRIATNIAYLTKFGVSSVTAVTQGALDSFTGFIVQAAILLIAFLFSDLDFGVSGDFDINWATVLIVVAAVIIVGGVVVWMVQSLRERVLAVFRETFGALGPLFRDPRRALALFGSNFGTNLVLALTLWLMVRAYGPGVSLASALVVVVFAQLLGGLAPTPGGVGVQEAVLSAGLVAAGVSQDVAFAAAIMYRVVTFLLPPVWGYPALHWLERRGYV
jgi:uncharacterized protein (TIRG00374 family)